MSSPPPPPADPSDGAAGAGAAETEASTASSSSAAQDAYENEVAACYFAIARAEGSQEDALDETRALQREVDALRDGLADANARANVARAELAAADAEAKRAADERAAEEAARRDLEASRCAGGDAGDAAGGGSSAADEETLRELILAKTELAEVTELRDRKKLEKKQLEARLAAVKYDLAMILAANDDDDAALQILRSEHERLEAQLRLAKGIR